MNLKMWYIIQDTETSKNTPLLTWPSQTTVSTCHYCLNELRFYIPLDTFLRHSPSQGMEKTKPKATKVHIHQSKEMYYNTK